MGVIADTINTVTNRIEQAVSDGKISGVDSFIFGPSMKSINNLNMPIIIGVITGMDEKKQATNVLVTTVIFNFMIVHAVVDSDPENTNLYQDYDNESGIIYTIEAFLDVINEDVSQALKNAGNGRIRASVDEFEHQKGRIMSNIRVEADTCGHLLNNRQNN